MMPHVYEGQLLAFKVVVKSNLEYMQWNAIVCRIYELTHHAGEIY